MRLTTSLLPFLATLGTTIASPALSLLERQGDVEMLYLFGLPGVTGSGNGAYFVGRGTPGQCQNFPTFVQGFTEADPIQGYTCALFLEYSCKGSAINIGPTNPYLVVGGGPSDKPPVIKSWRCNKIGK